MPVLCYPQVHVRNLLFLVTVDSGEEPEVPPHADYDRYLSGWHWISLKSMPNLVRAEVTYPVLQLRAGLIFPLGAILPKLPG